MPTDFQGPARPDGEREVAIELVMRLDEAIEKPEARGPLRNVIGELAADARGHAMPPEMLLILIKSHLWARTSGLDMIARRELVEIAVRWAIEEYYQTPR